MRTGALFNNLLGKQTNKQIEEQIIHSSVDTGPDRPFLAKNVSVGIILSFQNAQVRYRTLQPEKQVFHWKLEVIIPTAFRHRKTC